MLHSLEMLNQYTLVQSVLSIAQNLGLEILLVGGAVRDALLTGERSDDLDFLVIHHQPDHTAKALAEQVAKTLQGSFVPLDEKFGIYRVVVHQSDQSADPVYLDFSDALENNLEQDLARRDLTINALAWHPTTAELIDHFDGVTHLQNGIIQAISETNFTDDPLRLIRIFRMAACLQDKINPRVHISEDTMAIVKTHQSKIYQVAAERIQYELFRMVSASHCFQALQAMADCGLLETLFPEMTPMRQIPSNGHHHLGLFEHTLELVRQAERLILELPEADQGYFFKKFETSPLTHAGLVKLACLFHDLGKPDTMAIKSTPTGDRFTFYTHEQVSESLTSDICNRLKTGSSVKEALKFLTRWHLYPCQFGEQSPRKSVLRFYRKMGVFTPDVLLLALADRHSTLGPDVTRDILETAHHNHLWLLQNYHQEQSVLQLPKLLNGHQVMQVLNIKPGPKLKEILNALEEAQQLGEIQTEEEALSWVKSHYA